MNHRTDHLDPAFDPRIADWLEADPVRAPGEVIDTILAALPSIPQRRTTLGLPWRFPMPSSARLVLTAVAIAAVGFVGLTFLRLPSVGPAATASPEVSSLPSALPPLLTERFDSTFNGISMNYPAGWQTRPATERWTDGVLDFGASGADIIFDPTRREDLYFAVGSQPVDGRADFGMGPLCRGSGRESRSLHAFDGVSGWIRSCTGPTASGGTSGARSWIVETDGRFYAVLLHLGDEGLADAYSHDWFKSVLETIDLRPEDALERPSPSVSP